MDNKSHSDFLMEKIVNESMINELKNTVLGFWPYRKDNSFPGPLPISIEREHFTQITKNKYVISLKSDGTRYMFMLYNGCSYLIDRSFIFYKVNVKFNDTIYGLSNESCGLLLDGEMIEMAKTDDKNDDKNETVMTYLVHDCVCIFSRSVKTLPLTERYECIKIALQYLLESDFTIKNKKYYLTNEITKEIIDTADHKTDGLIIMPIYAEIGNQGQNTLFKLKQIHTVDFKIVEKPTEYEAYVYCQYSPNNLKLYASTKKTNPVFKKLLDKYCPDFKSGDIVECIYNDRYKCFDPFKIRKDKDRPNNVNTANKTMLNAQEGISVQELLTIMNSV